MKYFFGLLTNSRNFQVTERRPLIKGYNFLTIFDVIENTNGEISCRWRRHGDDIFGLSTVTIFKERFLFGEPFLTYATSLDEMDKFLETLDSKIPIVKIAINTEVQKISAIRREKLKRVLKREVERINQKPRLEQPQLSEIRYLFYIRGCRHRYYPYPTYMYKSLRKGESLLKLIDTIDNTLGSLTCRWLRVSNREFDLVRVICEGNELLCNEPLTGLTSLDEMDRFLELLSQKVLPTDSKAELSEKTRDVVKLFKDNERTISNSIA